MRRYTLIITAILIASASFSFADEGERQEAAVETTKKITVKEATLETGASSVISGKVESVAHADLARPRSKIVIKDDSGNFAEFTVKALAVIYDSTGGILTLNDIKPGRDVKINYTRKTNKMDERADRIKEAIAIKILNR